MRFLLWINITFFSCVLVADDFLPQSALSFFENHCFECHQGSEDSIEGNVNLEAKSIDWSKKESTVFWTRIYEVIHSNEMPPKEASSFPATAERLSMLTWLNKSLTNYAPPGGTLPRRLNRVEYENTIRNLFNYSDFKVPPSFPEDDTTNGFDNIASGLVLSPTLLSQYLDIATSIADEVLPEPVPLKSFDSREFRIKPFQLKTNEGDGAALTNNTYRLVSSRNMASAAGWTSPFEVPVSGVYKIKVQARTFQTDKMFYDKRIKPFRLELYARQNGEQQYEPFGELRALGGFNVTTKEGLSKNYQLESKLFEGEVIGFRWADGPVYSDPGKRDISHSFIDDRLLNDSQFYAAAIKLDGGKRGSSQIEFYEGIRELIKSGGLDLENPKLKSPPKVYGGGLFNGPHNWCKAYAYEEMHRFGPALDILNIEISGPDKIIPDQLTLSRLARSDLFLGRSPGAILDISFAENFLRDFLFKAFRKPVSENKIKEYLGIVEKHRLDNPDKRIEDSLHLAVRRAIISPHFLFRGLKSGFLDDWGLASRLSYFLNSSPPDAKIINFAKTGKLSDPIVLESETRRLLKKPQRNNLIKHFTGQWLGTRRLKDIMPDPRLLKFYNIHREAMIDETEMFFEEMITENHTLDKFIDPGFSYRNKNLNNIYGGNLSGTEMQRITFDKGGRSGGLLGLASIMMATANGVDTHPVHRGVWLLENVLGSPTSPPPPGIPSIAPDTSGSTTMRERMIAHQQDTSCASCHKKIDPLGFVMENYDPVGRWREHYPVYTETASEPLKEEFYSRNGKQTRVGQKIDSSGLLPDGTVLKNVVDLKTYLLTNMNLFTECLVEKLLVYGTGRSLSFGDKRISMEIAKNSLNSNSGFQDLIVDIVLSESFLTR